MSKIFDAYRKRVGEAPDLTLELGRIGAVALFPEPNGKQQEEFGRLATQLQGMKSKNRGMVLGIAASTQGEGSSYVSYHTAYALVRSYQKDVAWIDGNFLNPQSGLMGRDQISFADLLQEPERVDEIMTPDRLTLIPGGRRLAGIRGQFSTAKYTELVAALARRFDYTIIDLPPVLSSTDAALMAAATDGLLLVIEHKFLKREVIGHGLQGLRDKGVPILGSVINRRSFELPKFIYDRL